MNIICPFCKVELKYNTLRSIYGYTPCKCKKFEIGVYNRNIVFNHSTIDRKNGYLFLYNSNLLNLRIFKYFHDGSKMLYDIQEKFETLLEYKNFCDKMVDNLEFI